MSSVMRPSGKLPPGVYWRRRIVLAVVVLLVVWLLSRLVGGGDDADARSPQDSQPTATPTSPAATDPSAPPRKRKERKPKDVEVKVRLGSVDGACPADAVQVTPSVAKGTKAGGQVPIMLRVVTSNADACTVRIDPSTFVLAVDSSGESIWDTQACGGITGRTVDVHPSWATVLRVTWNGRAGGDSCDAPGDPVDAGSYTAKAALLGGEPAVGSFDLAKPPPPTPDPTEASPSTKPGASAPTAKPTGEADKPDPSSSPTTARPPD